MLFGLPLAVTAFNRFSRFSEMVVRRLLGVLYSMYFDDASFQDWTSGTGSAQEAIGQLMEIIGSPFADAKRQHMGKSADFLGLEHTIEIQEGEPRIAFWPRPRLIQKLQAMMDAALQEGELHPGTAGKLFGLANFLNSAYYGRVGRAGMHAIKERQY